VDSELNDLAWTLSGRMLSGWLRVQAICDFVHQHLRFDYMARGRDAADTALTTTFGVHPLASFTVWTDEVSEEALRQPQYSPRF